MKRSVTLVLLACGCAAQAGENTLTLGAGIAAAPRYSGSHEMQAAPILVIDYQMANGFYASTMRGLGLGTSLGGVSLDAALGVRGARGDDDRSGFGGSRGSRELAGMGKVKASATLNLRAGYDILPGLGLAAHASLPLSQRQNGRTGGIELTGVLHADDQDRVALSLGANFADRKYMQTYYGVSAAQAARSRFAPFTARAGMVEALLNFAWERRMNQQWRLTGMLGSSTLVRDAARSPLSRRATAPVAALYASYRY